MKKRIFITGLLGLVLVLSNNMYANTPVSEKHTFKNTEREINFELERRSGEIVVYIQSTLMNTYDQIIVERMGDGTGGYAACKTIDVAKVKITGDTYVAYDKFPLPAQTESSYRVKTIAKDGTTKTFPPVQLAAFIK